MITPNTLWTRSNVPRTSLGMLCLNLDHYQACFEREEVDLTVFLAMTEADLKEVGMTTLGARRKLQIASSELKKKIPAAAALPQSSASLGRSPYRSTTRFHNDG